MASSGSARIGNRRAYAGETLHKEVEYEIDGERRVFQCLVAPIRVQGEVVGIFGFNQDVTERMRQERQIHELAFFDPLTGLPNRRLMYDRLEHALSTSARRGTEGVLLLIDLDHFKDLNDSHGHDAGDQLLVEAGVRLNACIRQGDTAARLGGGEFVVILEDIEGIAQANTIATRIGEALARPFHLHCGKDGERVVHHVSASIGIGAFGRGELSAAELLRRADTAMYQAKDAGRRTFCRYDDSMEVALRRRAQVSGALRKVLDRGELRLVFQPRLALSKARITGVEALLRWHSDEHGEIPPVDFIPMAEESGLILEIGEWVLREACLTLQRWRQHGLDHLTVSVNVSVLQLLRGDFPDVVNRVLTDIDLPPSALELELTESVLMANAEHTAAKLQAFRALGVSLAIDDFGTGYSSLAYLKRLPITTLKIDKAFIGDLTHDPEDAAITSTVITMAHSLGLNVVAEGVETDAQIRFLASQHCDEVQGFWLSPPLDAHACLAFIRNWRPVAQGSAAQALATP